MNKQNWRERVALTFPTAQTTTHIMNMYESSVKHITKMSPNIYIPGHLSHPYVHFFHARNTNVTLMLVRKPRGALSLTTASIEFTF